jgi:hypothetical protein
VKVLICVIVIYLGVYFTGDGAYRTKDGYYQITGRMDDVLNVSGHRLGTAEIEDVIVSLLSDQLTLNLLEPKVISLCQQYRARPQPAHLHSLTRLYTVGSSILVF